MADTLTPPSGPDRSTPDPVFYDHGSPPGTQFPRRRRSRNRAFRTVPVVVAVVVAVAGLTLVLLGSRGEGPAGGPSEDPGLREPSSVARSEPAVGLLGFAVQFANDYLTWDEEQPAVRARALAPYLDERADPALGWDGTGVQRAVLIVPVTMDDGDDGLARVTVAAEVTGEDAPRWVHLQIPILRDGDDRFVVAGMPALVPPPPAAELTLPALGRVDVAASESARATLDSFFGRFASQALVSERGITAPGVSVYGLAGAVSLDTVERVEVPEGGPRRAARVRVRWDDTVTGSSFVQDYEVTLLRSGDAWVVRSVRGGLAADPARDLDDPRGR